MSTTGKTYTVLIVDDEERLRKALARSAGQEGYRIRTAASGEEALVVLQLEKVDLVITDLVMPGMDGMSLVRAIREIDPGIPTIILTAYGSAESMAEAKTLDVAYYLTKPFDLFHLKSRMKRLLRDPRASESSRGGDGARALRLACSAVGRALGVMGSLPRKALPYVHPQHLVFTAGKAAGVVSGLCQGIWRRFAETR